MAISIGSKPDVPAATADIEEKGQEAAREVDAKKNAQRVERKLADGEKAITDGAAGKGISTLAVKDLLASADSTALLEALLQAPVTQAAEQPKGDTAYETLAKLKDLLGKPNGLPVPEKAFEHADLIGAAAFPGLLSQEGTELLAKLATPEGAAQASQLVEGLLSTTGIAARAGEIQVKGETTKATKEYVQKLQLMAEKFLNASAQAVPPPNLPAAVQKIFAANFPEISKAVKDFMKSAKPKDDDEIVIPDFAVLAFEQAIKPTVEKFTELAKQADQAAGPAEGSQALLEDISAQTSPVLSALFADVQMVKADDGKPTRAARWSGVSDRGHFADLVKKKDAAPEAGAQKIISAHSPGMSVANADLESLIYFVMMHGTALEGDILTDKLKEMQETNAKKKAQREKITHMKKEKSEAENFARKEYEYLQAQGAISPKTSFDDYMAWRQITWTPEGDALLQQPMPPLPDTLIFGPDGPPQGPPGPGAVGDPAYPCNVDANAMAEQYGVSPEDIAYLNSYYQWVQANGSSKLGIAAGGLGTFEEFLANTVGITDAGKGQANKDACKAFFDSSISGDSASGASGTTDCTQARFDEIKGKSKDEQISMLEQALSQPPLCDDPEIKKILEYGVATLLGGGGNAQILERLTMMGTIAARLKELAPKSEAMACAALLGLPGASKLNFIKEIGGDEKSVWGGGAFPVSSDVYSDYKNTYSDGKIDEYEAWVDASKGHGWYAFVFDQFYQMVTTQEPFKTELAKMLSDIHKLEKDEVNSDYSLKEALFSFMVGPNDAEMDNGGLFTDYAVALAAKIDSIAPGSEVMAQFLALESFCEDPEFWTNEGHQDPKFENPYEYFSNAQEAADDEAKAKEEEEKTGEGESAPEAWGTTFANNHTQSVADDAEAAALREAAKKARDKAHAAAKEGVAHLQTGHGLEGEKGAITGSMAMLDAQIEGEQNKMDSLSDLSQMQSVALNQALDHRQKLLEALTNIMKKLSNTSDAIISNNK